MKQRLTTISLIGILVSLIMHATVARGEYIFLKTGAIVKGKITREDDKNIILKTVEGQTRTFPRAEIMRTLYSDIYMGRQYIRLTSGKVIQAYMVDEDQETYTFRLDLNKPEEFSIPRQKVLFFARKNPNDLEGTVDGAGISLNWKPPLGKVTRYRIYCKEHAQQEYPKEPAGDTSSLSFRLTALMSATTYSIVVTAIDESGEESLPSNELELTTQNNPPAAPAGLACVTVNETQGNKLLARLRWKEAIDADGTIVRYEVRLRKQGAQEYAQAEPIRMGEGLAKTGYIEYLLPGLADAQEYEVLVRAFDNLNAVSADARLVFSTRNIPPDPPAKFTVEKKPGSVQGKATLLLSWLPAVDPDGEVLRYRIYLIKKEGRTLLRETRDQACTLENQDAAVSDGLEVKAVDNRGAESGERKTGRPRQAETTAAAHAGDASPIGLNLTVRLAFLLPIRDFADLYGYGAGALLSVDYDRLGVRGLTLGFETGYYFLQGSHEIIKYASLLPLRLFLGYKIRIGGFFSLFPRVGGGGVYSMVYYNEEVAMDYGINRWMKRGFQPMFTAGIAGEFLVAKRVVLALGADYEGIIQQDGLSDFMRFYGEIGYRF